MARGNGIEMMVEVVEPNGMKISELIQFVLELIANEAVVNLFEKPLWATFLVPERC